MTALARCGVLAWSWLWLSVAGCGSDAPPDPETVPPPKDSGHETFDTAADAGPEEVADTSVEETIDPDTGADTAVRDTGPEVLPCEAGQFEPNGSEGSALGLKDIDDCDGSGGSFSGTIGGGGDVDWWTFKGKDTFGCTVDPTASTKSGVRVCIFVACEAGATEVKSCPKGTKAKSPAGSQGCCSDSSGNVEVDFHCTLVGTNDSAAVYMRVDDTTATTCKPYKVDYHY